MRTSWLRRPSPALVVSIVAVVIAMGGTAYAAVSLPKNSVGTKQIKNNAVTGAKIKNGAVTAGKINASGLTVPNALHANAASSATSLSGSIPGSQVSSAVANANVAAAIGNVTYVKGNVVAVTANGGSGYSEGAPSVATCPAGTAVIGDGAYTYTGGIELSGVIITTVGTTTPAHTPNTVTAYFDNFNNFAYPTNYVVAICAAVNASSNAGALFEKAAASR